MKRSRNGMSRTMEDNCNVLQQSAKSRAQEKKSIFSITKEWILERLQKGHCEVTGLPFVFQCVGGNKHSSPYAPSLDRIDNLNRDQSPENTRIVCLQVNIARNRHSDETNLAILRALVPRLEELVQNMSEKGCDMSEKGCDMSEKGCNQTLCSDLETLCDLSDSDLCEDVNDWDRETIPIE